MFRKTLTFNQSITEYQIPVAIHPDSILEGMEEYTLRLESLSGLVTVANGADQATVEINDGSGLCMDVLHCFFLWFTIIYL